jgi:hypothetical protein
MVVKKLILAFAVIFSFTANAQTYSNNREKFTKEFQKSLTDFGKGEFHDFAKKQLPVMLLETSDFPEAYFTKMVETCNLMETKKLKPYPEIYQYVFSVYSFVKGKQSSASYQAWHSSVDKLLDNRNIKKFEDFIDLSAGFFSERKIAESSNFKWYYEGGEYSFEFTDKPFIKCSNGNLICRIDNRDSKTKKDQPYVDSLVVFKTNGTYDPVLKKWEGTGGTLTWEKVGLPKNETFATLKKYDVSCKSSNLGADSVALTTKYFTKPIMGSLSDRAFTINREEDKIYPQFLSYEKRLRIKNIKENVDYDGGFSMQGSSFVGMGTPKDPAKILIYRNNLVFVKAAAQQIYVSPKKISCNNTNSAIYLNTGDSITHPGVHFSYDLEKKNIEMLRTATGNGQAPFQDSYHKVDIYVAKITWKVDEQDIYFTYDFGTSQEQRMASFESKSYFDERLYDRMQGLETVHPLIAISKYCYKYDEYSFNEGTAATALGKTIEQAKPLLIELSNYGFISYDVEAKTVTVNPKLDNFVMGKAGKRDYDNLIFVSDLRPKELKGFSEDQIKDDANLQAIQKQYKQQSEDRRLMSYFGKMNLGTLEIDLNAVDKVKISDAQNTVVFPEGSRVIVKENRNVEFSGWLNAGKMEINTYSANYNYSENKFNLMKTGESLCRVRPLQETDGQKPIAMVSNINGIKGELFVDDPSNRSGNNKKFHDYPKLNVSKPSFVYYNAKDIFRGAYDSTRFYYTVAPFLMDSLDNFNEKTFRLKGELTSAGIFPKISEDLKIMPDYSFGFSTKAPAGGYDFYGTGAKYENKIVLSYTGLQGAGTINFVESTSVSKGLLNFLPDSAIGLAHFTNRPIEVGIEFPDVESEEAFITYIPKKNMLKAASTPKTDLNFFKQEAKLRGTAIVTPTGMRGFGLMSFKTATTVSDDYRFKRWDINADTSGFSLKNTYAEPGEDPLAFAADNVKANISFKERKGEFVSNRGSSQINFPVNQYLCRMDKFSWFMDYAELQMEKSGEKDVTFHMDMDLVGPNIFSTHPKQDSLQFRSPKAKYDLKQRSIFCEKVEYLEIADARIYPDSMKVIIRKNAKMEPFKNSKIVANYITKYHTFVRANIEVKARRSYVADGEYPYYDKDSTLTYFQMKTITLDTSYQTIASGVIAENQGFKLSKEFDYYGNVGINASNPLINFSGSTRINHTCDKFDRTWMSFTAPIDPKNIQIPVSAQMKNLAGDPISAGIVWRNSASVDSIKLYPTFLSQLVVGSDPVVMTASGYLQYNMNAKEFQIGSKEKLLNRSEKGNFLALHTESCSLNGEGVVNLGMDYGDVIVDAVGVVNYNQTTGQTTMNLTARFNMAIDKGLMEDVATRINAVEGLKPMDFNTTTFEQALLEWTDQKTADRIKSDYTIKGEIKKLPAQVETAMTITGLRLSSFDKPSEQEKGIISTTETAVLVNMYEKPIMKYVPMRAFFQQVYSEAGGDRFGLQIDIPGGRDYYFDYQMVKKEGEMKIVSGDGDFNTAASAMKEEKRKTKNFKFEASTQRVYLSKFLRLFGQ